MVPLEAEACVRGLDDVAASKRLGLESGGLAFWIAAVREAFEEAGVLLAERIDGGPVTLDPDERHLRARWRSLRSSICAPVAGS